MLATFISCSGSTPANLENALNPFAYSETVVEFDVCNASNASVILRSGSSDVCVLTADNSGALTLASEKVTATGVDGGTPIKIKIVIDEKAKTADLYVGGSTTPSKEDVAIDANAKNEINRFMIKANANGSTFWIDNINIYRQQKS